MTKYADAIGLAFQIVDDVLDEIGDEATLGKPVGGDQARGKTTYPSLVGVEVAQQTARSIVDDAKGHLAVYGERGVHLCAIADFIVERVN